MRISDWSSDVCSSDLRGVHLGVLEAGIVLARPAVLGARDLFGVQGGARDMLRPLAPTEHGEPGEAALVDRLHEEPARWHVAHVVVAAELLPLPLQPPLHPPIGAAARCGHDSLTTRRRTTSVAGEFSRSRTWIR